MTKEELKTEINDWITIIIICAVSCGLVYQAHHAFTPTSAKQNNTAQPKPVNADTLRADTLQLAIQRHR